MLYLRCQLKNCFNFKIKTLKHCENLLKVSNEIKQYVKIQLLDRINDFEQVFQYKIKKIKNDVVVTTQRQISLKNAPQG